MLEVLTNPGEFFENKMKQEADFKPPIMIIGIMAIISAISAYVVANAIAGSLQGDAATFVQIGAIIGAIFAMIVMFIMWIIYGGIFYVISIVLVDREFQTGS
jgi:hypothetical protein